MGLTLGNYVVKVDPKQMKKLHMKALPDGIPITICQTEDGDIVEDINFTVISTK